MQRRLLRLLDRVFGEGMVEFELSVRIGGELPFRIFWYFKGLVTK